MANDPGTSRADISGPVNHARADARHKLDELKTLIADEAFFIGSSLMGSESEDVEIWRTQKLRNPLDILEVLRDVLLYSLPEGRATFSSLAKAYSRPALLARYWLPGTVLLFSSKSLIQFVSSNRVEITEWIRNLGETLIDFWGNWVVEPIKKLIGTIRHEDVSEIALMSRASLEADQASLERMVIEFASDHDAATSSDVDMLRQRVKEGDLTEVLKSYERDLRRPFLGTVRGDLVRALLIQIQKTKVDVELAIGGIDALLRSQELVFG
ncbi:Nuclear control of ATPase protein 2 [Ascosphaera atra]|nr:Nuclear control of ATPase protein 2 [Ascosphaera atra]